MQACKAVLISMNVYILKFEAEKGYADKSIWSAWPTYAHNICCLFLTIIAQV